MRIKLYENRDFMRRTQIKLMQEEVHIWCIRWKEVIPVFEYYQLMLDQKEKEKMEEYYFYEDRMRYVAGKVITKLVLIQYLEEEEISFLSHKFGKPYYKSISGKQDIEFNISHSGEMILVAFSRDAKIGVDIQEIIDKNGLTDTVKIREEDAGVVLQLSESILFDLGKADLKADSTPVLEVISGLIPAIENEIMVQGHTDNIPISSGTYKSNWELSTSRAVNVVKYFIETKGFDPTRFSATGYGEYRPLVDNATEENRAINRRVDILIVQQKEIVKE